MRLRIYGDEGTIPVQPVYFRGQFSQKVLDFWFKPKKRDQPDNEAKLIATGDLLQIAAFADLHTEKVAKSLPLKIDYARARRLYEACLRLGGEERYFRKKMEDLEAVWKERGE